MSRRRHRHAAAGLAVAALAGLAAATGCEGGPRGAPLARPATDAAPRLAPGDVPRYASTGVSVTPRRVVVARRLPLTLEDVARDAALRDAPAAVGTLDHPAEGVHPRTVLRQAFGEHPMALRARLVIREHDVDRTEDDGGTLVEGFRYRVDVLAHDPDRPEEILLEARGEGEAAWRQPAGDDGPDFALRRKRVVPTLARLAFAAAVADAQRALDDRRDELAELARARMERAMREAAETRATQAARERARASETGTGTGTGTGTETEAGEPGRGSGDAGG